MNTYKKLRYPDNEVCLAECTWTETGAVIKGTTSDEPDIIQKSQVCAFFVFFPKQSGAMAVIL